MSSILFSVKQKKIIWLLGVFVFFKISCLSSIEFEVADIFGDNMVLQAGAAGKIWGKGPSGEKVSLKIAGAEAHTTIDSLGKWQIELPNLSPSYTTYNLVVEGPKTIRFQNILFGDVWYASGQSNMEWRLRECAKREKKFLEFIETAKLATIRFRTIKTQQSRRPLDRIGDKKNWVVADSGSVLDFSALAYLFANELFDKLDRPIGIIDSSWGGHPIEPFIPSSAFRGHPVLEEELRLSQAVDLKGLRKLPGGVWARDESWLAGRIYNSRVAPILPFQIKGIIWYQAESNCGTGEDPRYYHVKMDALIRGWREAWKDLKLPFYYVQLPQYTAQGWTLMRDEQRRALNAISHSGMVVTIDLKLDEIHPANKLDVAKRLAQLALGGAYERDVVCSGPFFERVIFKDEIAIITFKNTSAGLITGKMSDYRSVQFSSDKSINGFEILSEDGQWFPAKAVITNGNEVRCHSQEVENPQAVRYGWRPAMPLNKPWNLYNKAGLPASPFNSLPIEKIYPDVRL